MELKLSKYIYCFNQNNKIVMLNTLFGYIKLLNKEEYSYLLAERFELIDKKRISILIAKKILLPIELDEADDVRRLYKIHEKIESKEKSIFINLSYDCNLKCTYCFEKELESNENMTFEQLEEVFEFISNILKNKDVFEIVLYGGEPLLSKDINKVERVFKYACDNAIKVRIITNGVSVPIFIPLIVRYRATLDHILITLDGLKDMHNMTRVFPDGGGTYDLINSNLTLLEKENIDYQLRLNLGIKNNFKIEETVNEIIRNRKTILTIYTVENNCNLDSITEKLSPTEVANSLVNLYKISRKNLQVKIADQFILYFTNMLLNKKTVLPAFRTCPIHNTYIFDPDMNIYDCSESCHCKENIIGHVSEMELIEKSFDTFLDDAICRDCNISPICGGGCYIKRKWKFNENGECAIKEKNNIIINRILNETDIYADY